MRVDYQNIQYYTGKGNQKALAFAVLVKNRFANGKIYNRRKFDTKEFGISRTTYFRSFSDYFGMSPSEYRSIAQSKKIETSVKNEGNSN